MFMGRRRRVMSSKAEKDANEGKDLALIQHIFRVKEFLGAFSKYGDCDVTNSLWRVVFMAEAAAEAFNLAEVPGMTATHKLYDCGYEHARYLELCKVRREEREMNNETG